MAQTFVIDTNVGTIAIELDWARAPLHAANFAAYADAQFYDGLIFHRVIPEFMVQSGGHEPTMKQRNPTRANVRNESLNGLKNLRGAVAAARTADPDSAAAQFFINLKDNLFLDGDPDTKRPGYSVFGKVVDGMDVADQIARFKTGQQNGFSHVPLAAVVLKAVRKEDG